MLLDNGADVIFGTPAGSKLYSNIVRECSDVHYQIGHLPRAFGD
jgi:hypothetical protein